MVSHTEIAVLNANGHNGTAKIRSRNGAKKLKPNSKSPAKKAPKSKPAEPAGTDVVPVMKLKAIDLVSADSPQAGQTQAGHQAEPDNLPDVLHMPAPEAAQEGNLAGEQLVTDPELLELLQQLSETIDTANTVLEATEPVSTPQAAADTEPLVAQGGMPAEKPSPETELPGPSEEDLPLAAISEALSNQTAQPKPNSQFGFGLFLNAAISGLVLTAGAAWLVYTNPWLLDNTGNQQLGQAETAIQIEASKDQSSLIEPAQKHASATPVVKPRALASLAPPTAEPAPMQAKATRPDKAIIKGAREPIHTTPGQGVALNVSLSPGPGSSETSVMVQGIPTDAKLSQGKNLGSGNWLLNEGQLENLKLETGTTLKPGEHVIEFIVVKSDGSVPETRKVSVMVDGPEKVSSLTKPTAGVIPVATASQTAVTRQTDLQQAPAPLPAKQEPKQIALPALSPAEIKALLARGTSLLEEGDVAGARLLLEYAAQRGSKDAMVKLAQSYDPDHLLKLAVHGVKPDTKMSAHWYGRAETAQR